mmetsp:Transcript_15962/g.23135  ORF Transcript_15962/g.23135 Transcript_15962/m.23135 type:complete len:484 (-) Transcript_15962:68-1519(-)
MYKKETFLPTLIVPLCLLIVLRFLLPLPFYLKPSNNSPASKEPPRYDYASIDSGGKILDSSSQIKGSKGILHPSRDKYMVVPCHSADKWIEIGLNEDILMDTLVIKQGEIYSSWFKDIRLWGATSYPPQSWQPLGNFTLKNSDKAQKLYIGSVWVRFLRLELETHYGEEYYCTLTKLSVHGNNMLEAFNEDYQAKREEVKKQKEQMSEDYSFPEQEDPSQNLVKKMKELKEKYLGNKNSEKLEMDMCYYPWEDTKFCFPSNYMNLTEQSLPQDAVLDFYAPQITEKIEDIEKNNKSIVFRAMIEHMAQTEVKIEYIEKLQSLFSDYAETGNSRTNELEKKIETMKKSHRKIVNNLNNELYNKEFEVMHLRNQITVLKQSLDGLLSEQFQKSELIDKLEFKTSLLIGANVLLASFLVYKWFFSSANTIIIENTISHGNSVRTKKPKPSTPEPILPKSFKKARSSSQERFLKNTRVKKRTNKTFA